MVQERLGRGRHTGLVVLAVRAVVLGFETHLDLARPLALALVAVGWRVVWPSNLEVALLAEAVAVLLVGPLVNRLLEGVDRLLVGVRKFGRGFLGLALVAVLAILFFDISLLDPLVGLVASVLPTGVNPYLVVAALVVVAVLLSGVKIGALFDALTTHRGFFHSFGFAILFGGAAAAVVLSAGVSQFVIVSSIGAAGVIGVVTHLSLDFLN